MSVGRAAPESFASSAGKISGTAARAALRRSLFVLLSLAWLMADSGSRGHARRFAADHTGCATCAAVAVRIG